MVKIILMSPSTSTNHSRIASNITMLFKMYLKGKKCEVFQDNIDLHLSEKDIVIPDMMVVCNKGVVRSDGIYGAPNLIVEILSPSTAKKDKGKKKILYEKYSISEYWIVSPEEMSVEVNVLKEGKYEIENIYYNEEESTKEFKCSLFEDLKIEIARVFHKVII